MEKKLELKHPSPHQGTIFFFFFFFKSVEIQLIKQSQSHFVVFLLFSFKAWYEYSVITKATSGQLSLQVIPFDRWSPKSIGIRGDTTLWNVWMIHTKLASRYHLLEYSKYFANEFILQTDLKATQEWKMTMKISYKF